MSSQPLFLDTRLGFEKNAGSLTKLSDNVDMWPQEIMQEAYKQLPYLSNFEVDVIIDKMDEGRGYAFGSIVVKPRSDMPAKLQKGRLEKVHIPMLIKEQMLSPLDVFLYGKRYNHLTEGRLRAALFRPDSFDSIQDRPPEALIGNDLQPPALTGNTYGGAGGVKIGQAIGGGPGMPTPVMAGGVASSGAAAGQNVAQARPASRPPENIAGASTAMPAKMAAFLPLLPQLHGQVLEEHKGRLKQAMDDPTLRATYFNADEGVQAAMASALQLEPSDPVKTAQLMMDSIRADAIQVRRQPDGEYLMKWANAEAYAPQQQQMPALQAQQMVGNGQLGQQLQEEGQVTAAPQAPAEQILGDPEVRVVDQFGMWLVQDSLGNKILGWAFPKVFDLSGEQIPSDLFTNGSQYAMQDSIAGKMVGKSTDIPSGAPKGYGCLFYVDGGSAKAFIPMNVIGTFTDPQGLVNYTAETDLGDRVTFYFSDQLKALTRIGQNQVVVPSTFRWLPLKAKTDLVSDPSLFMKTASRKWSSEVELIGDGHDFSYRGPAVAKLASEETKFISRPDAEFLGVLMGVDSGTMKTALDQAADGQVVHLSKVRTITPLSEKMASAKADVLDNLREMPVRNYFLVKEAALLDDALTADKILGLGFINAENIATFVDMLPGLEEASSKLAELLFAVRVGLKDIPEVAVERMLVALEDVISGLRTLKQKEIRFGG